MSVETLSSLLKLPANERADLALALWESLEEDKREAEFELSAEQIAEWERRVASRSMTPILRRR